MDGLLPAYKAVGERRYRETSGRYWEDFEPGDIFEHRPGRTALDVDNTYFTLLTLNVQQVHFDAAYASRGGKSFIAAHSTAAKGKVSKIVARLDGPNTTPRIDTHWIVTEFGAVNMKGMSSTERAKALIALAHPEFRDELTAAAKAMYLI
jgi:acyl dehydratase